MLLDAGANINPQGGTHNNMLRAATEGGDERIVKMLLDAGVDVNAQDEYCSFEEFYSGCGFRTYIRGTALHAAVHQDNKGIVKVLLDAGTDVDIPDKKNRSPLHKAIFDDRGQIIKMLVEAGADPSIPDSEGRTALHYAASKGHTTAYNQLIATGKCDMDAKDKHSKTVLDYICISRNAQMLEIYLEEEKEQNSGSSSNSSLTWSPLHWACRTGSFEQLKLLSNAGYQTSAVETSQPPAKWTPLDIAMYYNNHRLIPATGDFLKEKWRSVLQSGLVHLDYVSGRSEVLLYRENSFKPSSKASFPCDGCLLDIYGLRFICKICEHFNYCHMCKVSSEAAHPDHEWICHDPDAKTKVHDDSGKEDSNRTMKTIPQKRKAES